VARDDHPPREVDVAALAERSRGEHVAHDGTPLRGLSARSQSALTPVPRQLSGRMHLGVEDDRGKGR
jgi:hypothetical protein